MKKSVRLISLLLSCLYLILPLLVTFLYSLSSSWSHSILPESLTLKWYSQLFLNADFIQSMLRSIILVSGIVLVAVFIMVPAIYGIVVFYPRLERFIKWSIIGTYAMPGVILSVGLLKAYSNSSLPILFVVIGAYFTSILPFMYQGIRNSLRNIDVIQLNEAAEVLGANKMITFKTIILPSIMHGVKVSALLSFSVLFGEFVVINMLLGSKFKTVQIFLMENIKKNGHFSSAIVGCYFILLAIVALVVLKMNSGRKEG
ncbi:MULTISPECIES: ABC transporter permease [unclassified Streptococcus]|uniref:ABC transporter permease n=1 Tax=unclassified Streptococcus TaxID=2608887 RepID=UPI00107283EE|nr:MULTISPECIES: ABC transporter permease subunit [unclassified Streptococcus]MBF0788091.1 ABC transporter permease subunit [Streptococcus sp. 19428wC2_LYSM12]MCQ9212581.1 ABC transporter permease subunit [Streptococcus sp. B01]MCQ9213920.1 ABC transporter permease subunit [Streptococcus sp. O1]TFV04851.1 ABC transporter permease subunit [Streptococcus sp. LYSM12]